MPLEHGNADAFGLPHQQLLLHIMQHLETRCRAWCLRLRAERKLQHPLDEHASGSRDFIEEVGGLKKPLGSWVVRVVVASGPRG